MSASPLLFDGQRFTDVGTVIASTAGTALTHSGTAHLKGGYTQLSAATPFDAQGFIVALHTNAASSPQSFLLDIAIGGAGAEQDLVANLLLDTAGTATSLNGVLWFPVPIPAGTRLAARQQNNSTTGTVALLVTLLAGGLYGLPSGAAQTFGADLADSNGTIMDSAAATNAKGAYIQLSASVSRDVSALLLMTGGNRNTTLAVCRWFIDIAIGTAGAEQVVIPNLLLLVGGSARPPAPTTFGPLPCRIPAGSRLAARIQSNIAAGVSRRFALIAYGIG